MRILRKTTAAAAAPLALLPAATAVQAQITSATFRQGVNGYNEIVDTRLCEGSPTTSSVLLARRRCRKHAH